MFFKPKVKIQLADKGPALACIHHGYCSKKECPLWVEMFSTVTVPGDPPQTKQITEGKCAIAWAPQLTVELRNVVGGLPRAAQGADRAS